MNLNFAALVLISSLACIGLVESWITSRLSEAGFSRSFSSFLAHFSPFWIGLLLVPVPEAKPHEGRVMLLLLAISLALRAGWHAARRPKTVLIIILVACSAAVVVLSKFLRLPPWFVTAAVLIGLFALSLVLHAILSGKIKTASPNRDAFLAALGFIVLLDLGLGGSYWRWDLKLLGPGRGYTPDSLVEALGVGKFEPPRGPRGRMLRIEPSDDYTILILGGSAAAGMGVSVEERFQTVLSYQFELEGRKVRVINGAAGQYVTANMVLDAVEGYRLLEPDLVILYLGFNDCSLMVRFNNSVGPAKGAGGKPTMLDRIRRRPVYQLIDRILARWRSGLRPPERPFAVSDSAMAENLRLIKEIYGESGGRIILFVEATRELWPDCRNTVKAVADAAGIEAVDTDQIMRDTFTSPDDYLIDEVHPNPLGHWALAMIIEGELQDRGLLEGVK